MSGACAFKPTCTPVVEFERSIKVRENCQDFSKHQDIGAVNHSLFFHVNIPKPCVLSHSFHGHPFQCLQCLESAENTPEIERFIFQCSWVCCGFGMQWLDFRCLSSCCEYHHCLRSVHGTCPHFGFFIAGNAHGYLFEAGARLYFVFGVAQTLSPIMRFSISAVEKA